MEWCRLQKKLLLRKESKLILGMPDLKNATDYKLWKIHHEQQSQRT